MTHISPMYRAIMEAVALFPAGATTDQLAASLGWDRRRLSSPLSKCRGYGLIAGDQDPRPRARNGARNQMIWRPK